MDNRVITPPVPRRRGVTWEKARPYLYLLPAATILFVFHIFPFLYGAFISVHKWGLRRQGFVGIANFRNLFSDPEWWDSLLITVYYVLSTVPIELVLGLLIAILLFGKFRGRDLFRLFYFMPYITSLAAIGIVWAWIFHANAGVANAVLTALGMEPSRFLMEPRGLFRVIGEGLGIAAAETWGGPSIALLTIAIVSVWYYVGFHVVIYLSGLAQIPRDLYDAARIDGAGPVSSFFRITLPLLSPTMYFLAMVATIGAFQSITLIYAMTGMGWGASGSSGAPLGTTRVALLYVFDYFYAYTQVGYAMSGAVVMFILILVMSLLQRRVVGRRVFYMGE